ncbi:MAG: metallophosphoesterase [Pseudomonadota bacterium]
MAQCGRGDQFDRDDMVQSLIRELATGDLDIIGDVHGEIESLRALLDVLGYSADGSHSDGRHLVFVGDLVDRGPDSVGVVQLVSDLVAAGTAQCLMGNHELNLLRGERRTGNSWFFDNTDSATQKTLVDFFSPLPVALERSGLQVVHACWHCNSIDLLRAQQGSALEIYQQYEAAALAALQREGLEAAALEQQSKYTFLDPDNPPPMLDQLAHYWVRQQMENPVAVVMSGIEQVAEKPFWANGKWRFVARVGWWNEYSGSDEVVVGHYWRSRFENHGFTDDTGLFGDARATDPLGPDKRVMCIDYSIGQRAYEREQLGEGGSFKSALAAYRVNEHEPNTLVFSPV